MNSIALFYQMSEIKGQLKKDLADVEWCDLVPHAQRDVLIVVNPSLDILEVGEAIPQGSGYASTQVINLP